MGITGQLAGKLAGGPAEGFQGGEEGGGGHAVVQLSTRSRLLRAARFIFSLSIHLGFIYISPCLAHFDFRATLAAFRLRDFAASLLGLGR